MYKKIRNRKIELKKKIIKDFAHIQVGIVQGGVYFLDGNNQE